MKNILITVLIFIACLWIGFTIARNKPLWNDEFYSMVVSINKTSYADQFLGKIPEGNNSPLFYSIQKLFCQMIGYQVSEPWKQGVWTETEKLSRILLRITSVVCMSLSIALVSYYFFSRYSIVVGLYGLFIYFSSYMVWPYWAETRPYALIVLLTTVQSLLFLGIMDENKKDQKLWVGLFIVNVLLSLSSVLCIGPILAVGALLLLLKKEDWYKHLFLTCIPVVIALFYYSHTLRFNFFFDLSPEQLIRDNMSRDRFYILFVFVFALLIYFVQNKIAAKRFFNDDLLKAVPYFLFTFLVFLSMVIVLGLFKLQEVPGQKGFSITSRYFICLLPVGVIATTIVSTQTIRSLSRYKILQWAIGLVIGWWLWGRFLKIIPKAVHYLTGI